MSARVIEVCYIRISWLELLLKAIYHLYDSLSNLNCCQDPRVTIDLYRLYGFLTRSNTHSPTTKGFQLRKVHEPEV